MRRKTAPEGWTHIKLGKYLEELSERHNTSSNSDIPVLSVTNRPGFVVSEEFFDRKVFSKDLSNYKIIRKGQFAYNPSRVNVGSIARLKEFNKGLLSPMYVVFDAKEGLDGSYLDYWISSQRFRNLVKAGTQGSVRDSLNFSALAEFPFNLPPQIEQKKIVSILACVDSVIDKTQAVIDQTQTLKKGLMQELFTCGIPGRHKRFKKTEIGLMPEEWEVIKLGEIIKLSSGDGISVRSLSNSYSKNTPYPVYGGNGVAGFANRFLIEKPVIVIGRVGHYCGVVHLTEGKVWISDNALYTKEFYKEVDLQFLKLKLTAENISKLRDKGGQPLISQGPLHDYTLGLPTIQEQNAIAQIFYVIEKRGQEENFFIDSIKNLKSALTQVLLSGEVRVKV